VAAAWSLQLFVEQQLIMVVWPPCDLYGISQNDGAEQDLLVDELDPIVIVSVLKKLIFFHFYK
jgi:hypothetical protein